MAKRTLAHLMIIIGAALIVIAVLLPTFLVPRLKVIPLDTVSTTVTEVREGSLLDSGALASGEAVETRKDDPRCEAEGENPDLPIHCFIADVPLKSSRHVRTEEPSDKERVTLEGRHGHPARGPRGAAQPDQRDGRPHHPRPHQRVPRRRADFLDLGHRPGPGGRG